ncbi:L-rhamnose mutarotase [Thalassotalea maritima]|uniref:L-rhamnose mutarotase n=1 Tax=Thalassotalea maritima TaxID=3242416 RepID=UPI003529A52C
MELKDNPKLIDLYEEYHKPGNVWPEVINSIKSSGIVNMTIHRTNTQLIMVLDVDESFCFEKKSSQDINNPKVQEWERLMENFQLIESIENSAEKWKPIVKIFSLDEH